MTAEINSNDDEGHHEAESNGSPRRGRSRRMQKQFWVDAPFRERVRRLTRQRGKTLPEVMDFAGVAADYAYKPAEARNTNVIMALAECLDVTPTELCGWPAPPSKRSSVKQDEVPPEVQRLQPLLALFSEQTAALVRALEPPKQAAPTAMLQLFYEQTEALLRATTAEPAEPAPPVVDEPEQDIAADS
jgi:hypothetical protein